MKKPLPFGKYYLLERINVGGMAEVFRAKAYGVEGFERLVAVKRILPNIAEDKEFISMFIDEAKIAVQLNHANIAQIFDLGMVDSAYYIALEHILGRDLRAIFDRCRNRGEPMPVAQACFCVMKVCEGLDYAHNKRDQGGRELNLVHRDVSPQNMMISFEGEVKLIDFGIAKAVNKNSQTQAGILKGKFGYMSPEQVRGLPIDRRSDIFSCGIVLYELLTGERLFVGESDFSTLEKVRNVEILPPSTYNRKIPDELERIVLKALAKDTEDRYQNAIDLHDELQAFVYTAGEFYSRKDLAGWMKKVFAKEIEAETSKLEEYRDVRPPEQQAPQMRRRVQPTAPLKSTLAMPSMTSPPPIPRSGTAPPNGNGAGMAMSAAPPASLEWDDEELETQIYANPEEELAASAARAGIPTAAGFGAAASGGMAAVSTGGGKDQDLSSLVQNTKGWEPGQGPGPTEESPVPQPLASGSNQAPSPFVGPLGGEQPAPPPRRDASDLVGIAEPIFESEMAVSQTLAPIPPQKGTTTRYLALALAAVVLVVGGVAIALFMGGSSGKKSAGNDGSDKPGTNATKPATDDPNANKPTKVDVKVPANTKLSKQVLAKTGFNLFIEPIHVAPKVKLTVDGKPYTVGPSGGVQFRNLTPGDHQVEIQAPAGFFSKTEPVTVKEGEAPDVTIKLAAMQVTLAFRSEPPGAKVTLLSGGKETELGETPIEHKVSMANKYEVRFVKNKYVNATRPIELTGEKKQVVAVNLERARVGARTPYRPKITRTTPKKPDTVQPVKIDTTPRKVVKKAPVRPKGKGTLLLGAKPSCKIYIGGRDTGMRTPQRNIPLSAGRHRITLVNNEHGIKKSFTVWIKPNEKKKVIKNYTKFMKK